MYDTCRHIKNDGVKCGSPAIKGTLFCHNHTNIRKLTRRRARYGSITIPFVFPEDRTSLQTNFFLVLQALAEGKIDNQTSNSMTRTLRACSLNLAKGPLVEADHDNTVQRVILTPDGEEIAPPREALEKDEPAPTHGPECPCRKCAEQYRGAAPERHHSDCKCGLCKASAPQPEPNLKEDGEENPAVAAQLYSREPAPHTANDDAEDDDSLNDYESIRQIYWARQDAMKAGLEPPPWPSDVEKRAGEKTDDAAPKSEPYHVRRYNEIMEQVEKNKQIANEIWRRRYPEQAAKEDAEKANSQQATANSEHLATTNP